MLVGIAPFQKRFTLHHYIFTKRSVFFRAARSGRWTPDTKPTDLHEHDPSIFDLYLHCVYQNTLPTLPSVSSPPPKDDQGKYIKESSAQFRQITANRKIALDLRFHTLPRLYILADSLLDPTTANLVIDEVASLAWNYRHAPGTAVIDVAFASTREKDGLRNLLADLHAHLDETVPKGDLPNAFLSLVFQRFLTAKVIDGIRVQPAFTKRLENVCADSKWAKSEYYQRIEPSVVAPKKYAAIKQ